MLRDIEENSNNNVQNHEQVVVSSNASVVKTSTSSWSSGKSQTSNKNSSRDNIKWARNEINELIATRHPDYSTRQKRNALDRVRMQLESAGIFATTTEIQNKLNSLRVYYSS